MPFPEVLKLRIYAFEGFLEGVHLGRGKTQSFRTHVGMLYQIGSTET